MKKIYLKNGLGNNIILVMIVFLVTAINVNGQQSYTFTNASATGSAGPTQLNVNNAYALTNLNGSVVVGPQGIQNFTIPVNGGYRIEARGAKGYGTNGGRGASISGEFTLTAGTVLKILVGQQGAPPISPGTNQHGGGGGSFVTYNNNVPLIVAGGGGGSWAQTYSGLSDGTVSASGNSGANGPTNGAGGVNGNGGAAAGSGDGGGGLLGNGLGATGGIAFVNGGNGGAQYGHGGFGGGGGGSSWDNRRAGGGGGYSGGGGAGSGTGAFSEAGGGGSFNGGVNQINTSGTNLGDGVVIITELCSVKIFASGSNSTAPTLCSGNSLTLTTDAVSNYTWSTGITTNTAIVVSPNTTTTYSVVGTSTDNCQGYASITVTVSAGLPVLSISNPSNNICLGRTVSLTATGALTYTWTGGVVNGQPFTPNATSAYTVTGQNGCGTSSAVTNITVAPLPVSTTSSPTLVCQGYASTLTAVSAVGNYTWQPGSLVGPIVQVAPTANTIYTVTATDGTCSGTSTVEVQTKITPTISVVATSTNVCEGESVTLTASGAGAGGTYTWSPGGATGISIIANPTLATLFVANGTNSLNCEASSQIPVVVNQAPAMQISANTTLVCLGNSMTLTASGAQGYSWIGGSALAVNVVSPTAPTIYTVLGTHQTNTCVATRTIATDVVVPNITVSNDFAICSGESGTITASGANTYIWNGVNVGPNGNFIVTPASTSTFTFIANTQNTVGTFITCETTHSVLVTVNPNPTISVVPTKTIICRTETNTLTATGAITYSWSGSTETGNVINVTPNATTLYTITGTDANGCTHTVFAPTFVSNCTSISENGSLLQSITLYPNPNNGSFNVNVDEAITLKLINNLGQVIKTIGLNASNNFTAQVDDLNNGIYFLVGENGNGRVNQKVVVNK